MIVAKKSIFIVKVDINNKQIDLLMNVSRGYSNLINS